MAHLFESDPVVPLVALSWQTWVANFVPCPGVHPCPSQGPDAPSRPRGSPQYASELRLCALHRAPAGDAPEGINCIFCPRQQYACSCPSKASVGIQSDGLPILECCQCGLLLD